MPKEVSLGRLLASAVKVRENIKKIEGFLAEPVGPTGMLSPKEYLEVKTQIDHLVQLHRGRDKIDLEIVRVGKTRMPILEGKKQLSAGTIGALISVVNPNDTLKKISGELRVGESTITNARRELGLTRGPGRKRSVGQISARQRSIRQGILERLDADGKLPWGEELRIAKEVSLTKSRINQIVDVMREEGLVKGFGPPREDPLIRKLIETAILNAPHFTNDEIRFVLNRDARLKISKPKIAKVRKQIYEKRKELKKSTDRRKIMSPAFNPLGEPTEFAKRRRAILDAWKTGETTQSVATRLKAHPQGINNTIREMRNQGIIKGKKPQARHMRK